MAVRRVARTLTAVAAAVLIGTGAAACSGGDGGKDSGSAAMTFKAPAAADVLAKLPAKLADDGTTVIVGKPDAPHTVKVYLDPQCMYCAKFELGGGEALAKAIEGGKVKAEYTVASFLDQGETGGSTRAANAMRAALEQGKFAEFAAAVYANQPTEGSKGAFGEEDLLKIADKVPGLRGAAFDKAVKELTYKDWVTKSNKAFVDSGLQGTPAVLLGDKQLQTKEGLFTADGFAKALKDAGFN
ncbi:thioredoxin domain-containing protein [Streptomyces sp. NBC_01304]|uniref:thioredoxin domain-containing protein n=1 Tax=Streptomyces sp. NBC_01304 TaxID=2903818 RepID=UPI002E0D2BD6|nr:DsbA family protein [Streptomyces sp. NBC_01304]